LGTAHPLACGLPLAKAKCQAAPAGFFRATRWENGWDLSFTRNE